MNIIDVLVTSYPWLCVLMAFVLGAIVGSFLNVCIARMPLEKAILWPGSRCGSCFQDIRWYDNLPLVSYLRLGGKCRTCGAKFSSRYFWIEFLTAAGFALLFYAEVIGNVRSLLIPAYPAYPHGLAGDLIIMWLFHCCFFSCLLAATFTDIDCQEIPLRITIAGTVLAIVAGTLCPWPWPNDPLMVSSFFPFWDVPLASNMVRGSQTVNILPVGVQVWPVWLPVPDWMGPSTHLLGLITAVAGAAFGSGLMRLIRAVFGWALGKEALGLGDADLMMMIGAFLGWQSILFVLFLGVATGLIYVLGVVVINPKFLQGERAFAFGPFLALGALLTLLFSYYLVGMAWYLLEIPLQSWFFEGSWIVYVLVLVGVVGLVTTLAIRMLRLVAAAF
jgi:leader peptidase (prepilin peptidase)/N-methyltransferase